MDTVTFIALGALLLLFVVLATSRRRPPTSLSRRERARRLAAELTVDGGLEARVADHVAALAGPDGDEAERRLLSMGAQIIPHLLRQLERVDVDPTALTPRQQLALEALLADFGPQTFLQTLRFLRRVHRVSPLFPALVRVLARIGPPLLVDLRTASEDLPFSLLAPLVARLWAEVPPEDWVAVLVDCDDGGLLLTASLPALRRQPGLLDDVRARGRANRVLKRTPLGSDVAQVVPLADDEPLAADDIAAALDSLSTREDATDEGLLLRLAHHLDDPRVHERFLRLVEEQTPLAALALRELARNGERNLQPLLNRLLRASTLPPHALADVKAAVELRPGPCIQALTVALRAETPRVVLRAVEILSARPLSEHLPAFLKALGRHRYSPLEASLAAPVLSCWSEDLVDQVVAATRHEDREIQVAAVELIGFYGDARHVGALLELWGRHTALDDVVLNAIELIGVSSIPTLRRRLDDEPAGEGRVLRRRLELLELLADGARESV